MIEANRRIDISFMDPQSLSPAGFLEPHLHPLPSSTTFIHYIVSYVLFYVALKYPTFGIYGCAPFAFFFWYIRWPEVEKIERLRREISEQDVDKQNYTAGFQKQISNARVALTENMEGTARLTAGHAVTVKQLKESHAACMAGLKKDHEDKVWQLQDKVWQLEEDTARLKEDHEEKVWQLQEDTAGLKEDHAGLVAKYENEIGEDYERIREDMVGLVSKAIEREDYKHKLWFLWVIIMMITTILFGNDISHLLILHIFAFLMVCFLV